VRIGYLPGALHTIGALYLNRRQRVQLSIVPQAVLIVGVLIYYLVVGQVKAYHLTGGIKP
jgi:hypothetical protein